MRCLALLTLVLLAAPAFARARPPAAPKPESEIRLDEKSGEKEFLGCEKYPRDKRFRWGVRGEVGVAELIASVGEISCRTIVLPSAIVQRAGKVTLEVPDLLTAPEVWRLFYASLESMGLTLESSGKALKIVDAGRAREVSQPLAADDATPGGDQFVTRLLRVEHARPAEIGEVLGKLKGKEGEVSVYAPGASLVITDRASNVRRMEELARQLDVARATANDRLFALRTHQQSPTELSAALEKILVAARRSEASPTDAKGALAAAATSAGPLADGVSALVPVDVARLVVLVGSDDGFRRVLALARRIDPPGAEESGGQAHVVYLAHTNADEMATTLQGLGLASARPSAPSGPGGRGGGSAALPLTGEVRIAADKVSNAIVVFAGGADFQMVRDLIAKLDLPRRQVYVEATILDVTVSKDRTIGLTFHEGASNGSTSGVVASSGGSFNTVTLSADTLASALGGGGLLAGVLGKSFNIAGTSIPSFGVVLQALEHSKDVNVISRPHLLTMDNNKASLSVGTNVPYLASSVTSAATSGSLIATYQRSDIALKLDLTPHLNDSDSVRLELEGEISDIPDSSSLASPGGPTTNKRTIKTAIVVNDGETIVLGGLQKESDTFDVTKIPFLGDIPLLGRLFQTRSRQRTKQDLLIVLTPYVIRGPEDLRRIEQRKEDEHREFVERSTAFRDEALYERHVDYRRKRGLLEEINVAARAAETEAAALRAAEHALHPPPSEGLIAGTDARAN